MEAKTKENIKIEGLVIENLTLPGPEKQFQLK